MNRRIFINQAEPQGFPFIFGHPYFQPTNINPYPDVYEIHEPGGSEQNESNENLKNNSEVDDLNTNELVDKNEKYANSLSSDRLKIDPNYKWLLKDLNLSNDTRVIDVTDILDEKKDHEPEFEQQNEEKEEGVKSEGEIEIEDDDPVQLFYPNPENLFTQTSLNNTSRDLDDVTINTNSTVEGKAKDFEKEEQNEYRDEEEQGEEEDEEEEEEEYDEDHKNDHNYISKLYENLVKPIYDNESFKQNETIEENRTDCESEISDENKIESEKEEEEEEKPVKRKSKYSKSFEVSLTSMDNLIDRLDNGIKLKRAKDSKPKKNNEDKKSVENKEDSNKIVESLKQEWSSMFNKLENDYRVKLDEQQKLNDLKLKSLHDEIRKCIFEQERFLSKQPTNVEETESDTSDSKNNLKATITIKNTSKENKKNLIDASTSTESNNSNMISDNTKYITNLRAELKAKHSRHVQDLKDYYDKELEELRKKVETYETKYGADIENDQNNLKVKYDNLCELNADLKESNAALIHKLEECNEHISYLKHENYELSNNLNQMNSKLKYAEDKINSLQDSYSTLETQLSDSIKIQDKYVRELQTEKRNLMKKVQENEDFQMNIKYYEQKCESYELKLEERDTIITRLKAKLAQTETDLNRLDYEYQKFRNSSRANNLIQPTQQPYIAASNIQHSQTSPLQLPIKNQSRYSSVQNIPDTNNLNVVNPVLKSPRRQSPSKQSTNQQLTILCNLNAHSNTNQYSSSSSSSKSPARSRSPSSNKIDYEESKLGNKSGGVQKINQTPQENLIKYQNHLNQAQISNQLHLENEDLVVAPSSYQTYNRNNYAQNKYNSNMSPLQNQQQVTNGQTFKISDLTPDKQIKYIEKLENEFDLLMKQRLQLDAKLTRLPYKATNPSMHAVREGIEEELNIVEKKIASVKLELRKLNIIKSH